MIHFIITKKVIGLSEDITNEDNMDFPDAYKTFRKSVFTGDDRIANILRRFLQPCSTDIKIVNIENVYRVR